MGGACSNSAARTTADPSSSPTSNGSVVPAPTDIHHPNYSHQLPSGAVLVYHQYHYVMALLHDDKEKICHHFEKLKHDSLLKFADLQLPPGAADFSNLPPSLVSAENLEYGFATWKDEKLPEFDTLPYRQKLPLPEFERYTLGELFGWSHVFSMQSASFIEAMNCEKYKVKEYGGFYKSGTIGEKFPHTFWNDLSFGWQKGAGANPFQLKKVTDANKSILDQFDVSKLSSLLPTYTDDLANGRIFMIDYTYYANLEPNVHDEKNPYRYLPATVSIYHIHTIDGLKTFYPLAIALQHPKGKQWLQIYRPTEKEEENTHYGWKFAKYCVQVCDWVSVQYVNHLTYGHLMAETFLVSSHMAFYNTKIGEKFNEYADVHIVFRLLRPHGYKTLAVNSGARAVMIPLVIVPNAAVSPKTTFVIQANAYKELGENLSSHFLPNNLKNRGVDDREVLDAYPYAADSLVLWNAIHKFVHNVLKSHYSTINASDINDAITQDAHLQHFYQLVTQAGAKGTPPFTGADALTNLTNVVTYTIFTSTAHHASANYQQLYYLGYAPNAFFACYGDMPDTNDQFITMSKEAYFNNFPIRSHERVNYDTTAALSQDISISSSYPKINNYEQTLLQYVECGLKREKGKGSFVNDTIHAHLNDFHNELLQIAKNIQQRNAAFPFDKHGLRAYSVLDPTTNTLASSIVI